MIRRRVASVDDKSIYWLVKKELLPYTHQHFPNTSVRASDLRSRLNRMDTFVAVEGKSGFARGFVSCTVRDASLYVHLLAVDKKLQGRGIGSVLLDYAEKFGMKRKCKEAFIYVDRLNFRAQAFYSKHGYRPVRFCADVQCFLLSKPI